MIFSPKKHHYIPKFYLKGWTNSQDGTLCEFSKPYLDKVVPRSVHTSETGYVKNLYEIRGMNAEHSQQIEQKLMQTVDNRACDALQLLVHGVPKSDWPKMLVSSWTRFLMSLMFRMPEDLQSLRERWEHELRRVDPDLEKEYLENRTSDDPTTYVEFMAQMSEEDREVGLFQLFIKLHNLEKSGNLFNNMFWRVFDVEESGLQLFTSDRPIINPISAKILNRPLLMPVTPTKLFAASLSSEIIREIERKSKKSLVIDCNRIVISHAVKYAYSTSDRDLRFMQNRMSTDTEARLSEIGFGQVRGKH